MSAIEQYRYCDMTKRPIKLSMEQESFLDSVEFAEYMLIVDTTIGGFAVPTPRSMLLLGSPDPLQACVSTALIVAPKCQFAARFLHYLEGGVQLSDELDVLLLLLAPYAIPIQGSPSASTPLRDAMLQSLRKSPNKDILAITSPTVEEDLLKFKEFIVGLNKLDFRLLSAIFFSAVFGEQYTTIGKFTNVRSLEQRLQGLADIASKVASRAEKIAIFHIDQGIAIMRHDTTYSTSCGLQLVESLRAGIQGYFPGKEIVGQRSPLTEELMCWYSVDSLADLRDCDEYTLTVLEPSVTWPATGDTLLCLARGPESTPLHASTRQRTEGPSMAKLPRGEPTAIDIARLMMLIEWPGLFSPWAKEQLYGMVKGRTDVPIPVLMSIISHVVGGSVDHRLRGMVFVTVFCLATRPNTATFMTHFMGAMASYSGTRANEMIIFQELILMPTAILSQYAAVFGLTCRSKRRFIAGVIKCRRCLVEATSSDFQYVGAQLSFHVHNTSRLLFMSSQALACRQMTENMQPLPNERSPPKQPVVPTGRYRGGNRTTSLFSAPL